MGFLFFALIVLSGFSPIGKTVTADCPAVSNLHKTGETASTFTFAWDEPLVAVQYKVWWVRQEDGCTGASYLTTGSAFTFTGLAAGHYTFYAVTVCTGGESGWIGIEDAIAG